MIRKETKGWFRTSRMNFRFMWFNMRYCIIDFLLGIRMLSKDCVDSTAITIEYFLGEHQGWGGWKWQHYLAPSYRGHNPETKTDSWKWGPFTLKTSGGLCGDTYMMTVRRNLMRRKSH